ncbi:nitroreductase/quinone reductase family protein [Streptomyces sp. NPDC055099]
MGIGAPTLVAATGVPLAAAGLAAAFRGPEHAHWRTLTLAHGSLGLAALLSDRSLRGCALSRRDVAAALPVGLGLFAVGAVTDVRARRVLPRLDADAKALDRVAATAGPARMCACLVLAIAPGEELFWRGLLQDRLTRRHGAVRAAVLTSVLYGAAHVATGNSAVTTAALCTGGSLSWLRANGASVERLALAHAAWVVPTLLWERLRDDREPGKEPAQMTTTTTGRRVSRWSRLVQRANNITHTVLYEKSRGRLGTRMLGQQVGILTTVKRQDGQPYSVPLFTYRDGDDVIVVASYRGSAQHPAWFRNLVTNPDAVVRIGDRSWPVRATVLTGAERGEWWERVAADFKGYAAYQRRTSRQIPVVRLTSRPA